jgi:hypothetical protein
VFPKNYPTDPNEAIWLSMCMTRGHTSKQIAKFLTRKNLNREEKLDFEGFKGGWKQLLMSQGATGAEAEKQVTNFCAWAVKMSDDNI